jgi:hypothetical protein
LERSEGGIGSEGITRKELTSDQKEVKEYVHIKDYRKCFHPERESVKNIIIWNIAKYLFHLRSKSW